MSDELSSASAQKSAIVTPPTPQLDEAVWKAWVEKGRAKDRIRAKRNKKVFAGLIVVGGIAFVLFRTLGG